MTRIKICGITTPADAQAAADAGADAIGLVFAPSPRQVTIEQAIKIAAAVPPLVSIVGVFVDPSEDDLDEALFQLRISAVQLHGRETPDFCSQMELVPVIKRIHVCETDTAAALAERARAYAVSAVLIDPGAGEGRPFQWSLARNLPGRTIVSGGLKPENVADAIRASRPYAVDVSSGVEKSPGAKDEAKMRAFVQAVRTADAGN